MASRKPASKRVSSTRAAGAAKAKAQPRAKAKKVSAATTAPKPKRKAATKKKVATKRKAASPRAAAKSTSRAKPKAKAKAKTVAKPRPRAKTKTEAKVATKKAQRKTGSTANRRNTAARRRKQELVARPVLAFVGDAARWTVSPLMSANFRIIARRIIGVALFPLGWITIETFSRCFGRVALEGAFWKTSEMWFFGIGTVMWLVLFFGLRGRPMLWAYVFGHELTHATFVLLSGGNVKGVHVSAEGGYVLTNKNNLLIVLSPYFVPFYTVMVIALWWLAGKFVPDWTAERAQFLFAAIGFTWTFHVSFTIWMITREQPDLHHYGRTFSISLILLVNTVLISGLLIIAAPDVSAADFVRAWWYNFQTFGSRLGESLKEMFSVLF